MFRYTPELVPNLRYITTGFAGDPGLVVDRKKISFNLDTYLSELTEL